MARPEMGIPKRVSAARQQVDIYKVDLLRGGNVKQDDGYRTVATELDSFQVKVQRVRIDREACNAIEERQKGGHRVHYYYISLR
jgi:hypothetical protein